MARLAPIAVAATLVATAALAATAGAQYGDVDLREANVMGVTWQGAAGEYRFDVTLYHDDDGEDGHADHWQVESPDGEVLGRRALAHPHGTEPFTRSANVTIPSGVDSVVVRGHDSTHGYGGRAVVVHLHNGTARTVEQGSEPRDFGGGGADGDGGGNATGGTPDDAGDVSDGSDGSDDGNSVDDGADGDTGDAGETVPGFAALAAVLSLAGGAAAARRRAER